MTSTQRSTQLCALKSEVEAMAVDVELRETGITALVCDASRDPLRGAGAPTRTG